MPLPAAKASAATRTSMPSTPITTRAFRSEFLAVAPGQNALFGTKDTNHDGYISELESYKSIKGIYEANGRTVPAGLFAKHPSK